MFFDVEELLGAIKLPNNHLECFSSEFICYNEVRDKRNQSRIDSRFFFEFLKKHEMIRNVRGHNRNYPFYLYIQKWWNYWPIKTVKLIP